MSGKIFGAGLLIVLLAVVVLQKCVLVMGCNVTTSFSV